MTKIEIYFINLNARQTNYSYLNVPAAIRLCLQAYISLPLLLTVSLSISLSLLLSFSYVFRVICYWCVRYALSYRRSQPARSTIIYISTAIVILVWLCQVQYFIMSFVNWQGQCWRLMACCPLAVFLYPSPSAILYLSPSIAGSSLSPRYTTSTHRTPFQTPIPLTLWWSCLCIPIQYSN